jgi:DNA-binding XRE family transcriptional regulator
MEMKKSANNGMSQEIYEAIKFALENKKLIADTETGVVVNARSKGTGWMTEKGYLRMEFRKNGKRYSPKVHQVVAIAGGINPVGLTINHLNGIKTDNRLCNLEAITSEENIAHAVRTGLLATKLTEQDVREIKRLLAEGDTTQKEIANMFNVAPATISQINLGKTWTHVSAESFFNAEKDAQEAEYLHLEELYNNSTDEAERKALKRALYSMEVE